MLTSVNSAQHLLVKASILFISTCIHVDRPTYQPSWLALIHLSHFCSGVRSRQRVS